MNLEEALMQIDPKVFGPRLVQLREKRQLSRAELTERCPELSRRSIEKWEQGLVLPNVHALVRLAYVLRVPVDDLLGLPPFSQREL